MSVTVHPGGAGRGEWLRNNALTLAIVGVLLAGGGVGLAFNRTSAPIEEAVAVVPGDPASDMSAPLMVANESLAAPTLVRSASAASVSFEAITPPDNPFMRTAAEPLPVAVATPAAPALEKKLAAERARTNALTASSAKAPAAPAVNPDDLALTGVVQGDPPLAVVRYEGQSLFLKIGDQVADTWRLVEIKERSAIFQLGAQRVEVPIKGGSSE